MSTGLDPKTIVEITRAAQQFDSSIVIIVRNKVIDVKSILGLSVTLLTHDSFQLDIHGPDEEAAKAAMQDVFEKNGLDVVLL